MYTLTHLPDWLYRTKQSKEFPPSYSALDQSVISDKITGTKVLLYYKKQQIGDEIDGKDDCHSKEKERANDRSVLQVLV